MTQATPQALTELADKAATLRAAWGAETDRMQGVISETEDEALRIKLNGERNTYLEAEYLLGQAVRDLAKAVRVFA